MRLLPIGPLMIEHRRIERMVRLLKKDLPIISKLKHIDYSLIAFSIDFFKSYVDPCHHGKEEDILFKELRKKELTSEHSNMMDDLIKDHAFARTIIRDVETASNSYNHGKAESLEDILRNMNILTDLYPLHIEKEDKRFFIPCMEYFTKEELDLIIQRFMEFDSRLIHERYEEILNKLEESINSNILL